MDLLDLSRDLYCTVLNTFYQTSEIKLPDLPVGMVWVLAHFYCNAEFGAGNYYKVQFTKNSQTTLLSCPNPDLIFRYVACSTVLRHETQVPILFPGKSFYIGYYNNANTSNIYMNLYLKAVKRDEVGNILQRLGQK